MVDLVFAIYEAGLGEFVYRIAPIEEPWRGGVAMPTIQSSGDGYEVYVVTDASRSVTPEAHEVAVRCTVQTGGVRTTCLALRAELQRDCPREETVPGPAEVLSAHDGGTGVGFGWEMQLLGGARSADI